MQRDHVVGRVDGTVRRSEKRKIVARIVNDPIEVVGCNVGIVIHERKVAVCLRQDRDFLSAVFALAHLRDEIEGEIRVAAQAVAGIAFRHELGEDINPGVEDVTHDVRVMAAHIVLLGERTAKKASRLEVELADANIVGERAIPERIDVIELRVAGEQPLRERLQQTSPKLVLPAGSRQCQRSKDAQFDARVFACPPKKFVDEMIRLSQSQRRAEVDPPADAFDGGFDARFHIGVGDGALIHELSSPCFSLARRVPVCALGASSLLRRGPATRGFAADRRSR